MVAGAHRMLQTLFHNISSDKENVRDFEVPTVYNIMVQVIIMGILDGTANRGSPKGDI